MIVTVDLSQNVIFSACTKDGHMYTHISCPSRSNVKQIHASKPEAASERYHRPLS